MRLLSRRAFGQAMMAAFPLAWVARPRAAGVRSSPIGVATTAFADLPRIVGRDNIDDVIGALRGVGATHTELSLHNVEPAPPSTAPTMGGSAAYPRRVVLTPEQIAATNGEAREALRAWRLSAPAGAFEDARERFARAGIDVDACSLEYDDSCTDAEIDATFQQVRALGVATVSSPLTMKMARRLAPFAERHRVTVAIHNQIDGSGPGRDDAIDTRRLADALALSPAFALDLDIGRLTASNADVLAVVRQHLPRTSSILLSDRLRNGGASQPLGEGDAPLRQVLALVAAAAEPVRLLVGYDYIGLRAAAEEVRSSLAYLTRLQG